MTESSGSIAIAGWTPLTEITRLFKQAAEERKLDAWRDNEEERLRMHRTLEEGGWQCDCGHVNQADEEHCEKCGAQFVSGLFRKNDEAFTAAPDAYLTRTPAHPSEGDYIGDGEDLPENPGGGVTR